MSFVVGFVTGMNAAEAFERRRERRQFAEYMDREGYAVVDRGGHNIPLDQILREAFWIKGSQAQKLLIAGAVVTSVIMAGGSIWLLLSFA